MIKRNEKCTFCYGVILLTKSVQQLFLLNIDKTDDTLNYKNKYNFKMLINKILSM